MALRQHWWHFASTTLLLCVQTTWLVLKSSQKVHPSMWLFQTLIYKNCWMERPQIMCMEEFIWWKVRLSIRDKFMAKHWLSEWRPGTCTAAGALIHVSQELWKVCAKINISQTSDREWTVQICIENAGPLSLIFLVHVCVCVIGAGVL